VIQLSGKAVSLESNHVKKSYNTSDQPRVLLSARLWSERVSRLLSGKSVQRS